MHSKTPLSDPWAALAVSIVARAAQDAMGAGDHHRQDARQFLTSAACANLLEQLDCDPRLAKDWISRLEAGEIEPTRIMNRLAG